MCNPTFIFNWTKVSDWGYSCDDGGIKTKKYVLKVNGKSYDAGNAKFYKLSLGTFDIGSKTITWSVSATANSLTNNGGQKSFTVCVAGPPATPRLVSPEGETSSGTSVTFKWELDGWGATCNVPNKDLKIELYVSKNGGNSVLAQTCLIIYMLSLHYHD